MTFAFFVCAQTLYNAVSARNSLYSTTIRERVIFVLVACFFQFLIHFYKYSLVLHSGGPACTGTKKEPSGTFDPMLCAAKGAGTFGGHSRAE